MFVANQQLIPQDKLVVYYYAGIGICGVLLVALFISALIYEARQSNKEAADAWDIARREIAKAERLKLVETIVPQFIRMSERSDTFEVLSDLESIRLEWTFKVQTVLEEEVDSLSFPIYADIYDPVKYDPAKGSVISIEELVVDNESLNVDSIYTPLVIQERHPACGFSEPVVEQGILKIPVVLSSGPDKCNIRIVMTIKGAYQKAFEKEYIIVDIPYITDKLRVSIISPEGHYILKGDEFCVNAAINDMQTTDIAETYRQSKLVKPAPTKLLWETSYPKLGYRYKFFFKLHGENQTILVAGTGASKSQVQPNRSKRKKPRR